MLKDKDLNTSILRTAKAFNRLAEAFKVLRKKPYVLQGSKYHK